MRRLTWMRYNHKVRMPFHIWWAPFHPTYPGAENHVYNRVVPVEPMRQPMQRTEYYMPWGVVTVDELHRMN